MMDKTICAASIEPESIKNAQSIFTKLQSGVTTPNREVNI